jgi:hypothetical protein
MRLLHLDPHTQCWSLESSFTNISMPFYAILSHTWGQDQDEVKFEDIECGRIQFNDDSKPGYEKLRFCHRQAALHGLSYFWIDTCCIDKSSSAELQTALSSMFYWYQRATVCYVLLSDVSGDDRKRGAPFEWETAFVQSRWFKRGWTLQELLAPRSIAFFSKGGEQLGHIRKYESGVEDADNLLPVIRTITRIPDAALRCVSLSRFTVDERLSWSQDRVTKVPEDAAYCLVGLFGIRLYMSYRDGNEDERKEEALAELRSGIVRKAASVKQSDAVHIGGASWSDLTTLSQSDLLRLDFALDVYQSSLLNLFSQHSTSGKSLMDLTQAAGEQMRSLMAEHKIRYDDLVGYKATVHSWEEPWNRFLDERASKQARISALLENRWYNAERAEKFMECITAVRTLIDVKKWRGTWTG